MSPASFGGLALTAAVTSATANFVRPPPLHPGDRVAIVAPSNRVTPAMLTPNLPFLTAHGLSWDLAAGLFAVDAYHAGAPQHRAQMLLAALMDPQVKAIWAALGGSGAGSVLDFVDREVIARHPKWLVGLSDTTALHAAWAAARVMSLHATTLARLDHRDEAGREEIFQLLAGVPPEPLLGTVGYGQGLITGWLTGGNLTVLAALAGTGHLPSWEGAIVFFEDIGEPTYRLERSLVQLVQSGAMDGVAGVALGQLTPRDDDGEEATELAYARMVNLLHARLGLPVLVGVALGHGADAHATILGAQALLDLDGRALHVDGRSGRE